MFGNTTNTSLSDETFTILNLNNQKFLENIGGIIFISILMIVGIPGNVIVIYVYLRKYQPTTHRTFIVCLAMVDLASCCVSMPFFIAVLRYTVSFPSKEVCKIFHFLTYCLRLGSAFILLTIAAERYRKICIPHGKQLSEKMAVYICVLDLLTAGLLSWPGAVLYGNKIYKVGTGDIKGSECTVSDDFAGTKYPAYFNFVLLFIFIATVIPIFVMYSLIGKQIWKMKKRSYRKSQPDVSIIDTNKTLMTKRTCSKSTNNAEATQSSEDIGIKLENRSISILSSKCKGGTEIMEVDIKQKYNIMNKNGDKEKKKNKERLKTIAFTRIFFIITVVLFCSFLPNWALRLADFLNKDFLQKLSFPEIVAYQTFRWSFFINSMANPIIYGFCDRKFRQEIRKMFGLSQKYP
ncbi:hypothetical protein CHS0354_035979 [Potamilus streckersoni]|uniref:G-protein coupled receptors family 1 profile domain-containing protein n=1 Tax=Potamilus streckersoni TaxID=2493646 RepID=A0AAE0VSX0_9BIVA|nr:hypothetical protein CHS0354_035979 [Potamilus streckersoni]